MDVRSAELTDFAPDLIETLLKSARPDHGTHEQFHSEFKVPQVVPVPASAVQNGPETHQLRRTRPQRRGVLRSSSVQFSSNVQYERQ
jgi:hypothetical protein